jgi:hypothetical protein
MQNVCLIIIFLISIVYSQDECDYSTVGVLTDINQQIYNNDESVNAYSIFSWTSDEINRILNGNGIPNHEVGTFPNPNNPNTNSEQNVSETFTLCPELVSETGEPAGGPAGAIAGSPVSETNSGHKVKVSLTFCSLLVFGLLGLGNVPTSWFGIPFPFKILLISSDVQEKILYAFTDSSLL